MKKFLPLFLPALIVGAIININLSPQQTSALYKEDGVSWWTVEELLEFSETIEAESSRLCGDNIDCKQDFRFSYIEKADPKYQALESLEQSQFMITSFDFQKDTLKALYFDQDQMQKRMGDGEHFPLKYILLAWFDQLDKFATNYYLDFPIEEQLTEDTKLVYFGSGESFGSNGYPSDQIFELPIKPNSLQGNSLGYLDIYILSDQLNTREVIDYSPCLKDPDYAKGTECQLAFSANQGYRYFLSKNTADQNSVDSSSSTNSQNSDFNHSQESEPTDFQDVNSTDIQTPDPVDDSLIINSPQAANDALVSVLSDDAGQSKTAYSQITTKSNEVSTLEYGSFLPSFLPQNIFQDIIAQTPVSENSKTEKELSASSNVVEPLATTNVDLPLSGNQDCRRLIVFPWWLVILLIVGDLVILWWFLPKQIKNQKIQKIKKTFKNPLTK